MPIVGGGRRENEREIRNAFANALHTILRQKFCALESGFQGVVGYGWACLITLYSLCTALAENLFDNVDNGGPLSTLIYTFGKRKLQPPKQPNMYDGLTKLRHGLPEHGASFAILTVQLHMDGRVHLQGVQKFHEIVMWYFSQPNVDGS